MDTGQSKHRLLIVDGDPKSLRVLEVSLKKAGFEVLTATRSQEALAALQSALPDLIISDTDLDGMDGFDLCRQIKAKPEWAKVPFLLVSGRKAIEDKIRGLELGVEDYLTKPIYIREIGIRVRTALQRAERERLESRREGRTKFAGDLSDIGVVDLVQIIDLNRKSGIIHIVNRDGRRGAVFFRDGRVVDAEAGRLAGAEAMYRLFSWPEGRFEVEFKPVRRRDVVDLPSAALLMEGMRRLDEWTRLFEMLPPLESVVEVDFRLLADQLADLPDEVNGLLRLCDGSRTLLAVIDDSDYPDLEALTLASKLFSEHIIYVRESTGQRGSTEPSSELARWLAQGNTEDGPAGQSAGALVATTEVAGSVSRDLAGVERGTQNKDQLSKAERQAGKTLRNSSVDLAMPSLDTPPPRPKTPAASTESTKLAAIPQPTGSTLKLPAALPEQRPAVDHATATPDLSSPREPLAQAGPPIEASAVVEGAWFEPAGLGIGLPHMTPAGGAKPAVPALPQVTPAGSAKRTTAEWPQMSRAADAKPPAGGSGKPDTLKGLPLPSALVESEQARSAQARGGGTEAATATGFSPHPSVEVCLGTSWGQADGPSPPSAVDSGGARLARTTAEYGLETRDSGSRTATVSPSPPAGEAAREMDWGAWSQGAESKSPDADAPSAGQVPRSDQPPAPDSLSRREPLRGAEGGGRAFEERPQPVQADAVPVLVSDAGESTTELPGRRHPSRPGFDQMAGALPRERRKLLLPAAGLALLVAIGWLVTRAGSSASKSARSSGLAAPTAALARAASAVSAVPGAADAAAAQPAGPPLAVGPTPAPDAAPAQAEPARTAAREATSRAQVAANGTSSRADDGGQVRRPAPAPLGENELLGRCRRVDAGGKGKPALVLAACEPASEAEPTAADILVILARAELDRGNALEARSWAKKAVAVSPDLGDAYVFLGGAEQELGNPADAKVAYRKYLELAPNGRYARELRAVLDGL